jgi:mannose/fructose-specific phosphotransferase system component IIA
MLKFLILTHGEIGETLINCVQKNLNREISMFDIISYDPNNINISVSLLDKYIKNNHEVNLIILTDLYGSSSSNIVKAYSNHNNVFAISGLNLPMLMKAATFKTNDVQLMVDEIIKCGNKSIINFI